MPFKSEKQRKWMHANEPDMAKKWEKEEVIRGKLRNLIKQEMKSINEAKPKSFKFKFQCMECGKSFIKSLKKSLEVKCPKCKSVDIELENVNEDNIKFSKEEMAQLHKDGKVEKGGHTIEFNESTKEYGKTLDKIAKDRQLKSISKKDRDTLVKIAKLMKRANESTDFTPTMKKLAKSLGLKSVSQYFAGKGSLSYFLDDEREAKKLEKFLGRTFKRVRLINLDKSKGDTANFVVAADVKGIVESINEGFEKYHLGGLLDSRLKKRLERAIKIWGGKVDAVGDDYIKFRLGSFEVKKFPALLKKLDRNKNVWIGDKRKNNIWDRRRNIDKLREGPRSGHKFLRAKQMVFLPGEKIYFDPMTTYFWTMGPHGGPDLDDDPIEPSEKYFYQKIIKKLKSKDKSILKKAMRTNPAQKRIRAKQRKEATTSVSVPGYLTPLAFKKSTQKAIDTDDEDDEKSESMAAPFRRRNSRGLGRPMKVGINESVNEAMTMTPFSSSEAKQHINQDIKKMSKHLGKASQQSIKIMMDGVKSGKYTAMDISRGIKEGPAGRTHFGELGFLQQLWNKVRDGFRRYSKDRKLS